VFNLVKYRFAFIILSLLIIVPGVISLVIFHLKVGIDFAGGASVTLRPQQPISSAQVKTLLQPLKLQDAQITTGNLGNSNAQQAGNKTIWIRLNTQVDDNVVNTIKTTLLKQYPGINVAASNVSGYGNNGPFSLLLVTGFQNVPQTSDIKSLLNKLPNTTDTTKRSTPNSTSGPLAPTPTAAPQAKSTPTPKASATPQPTPTATPSSSNPANITVNVVDVSQGQTTQTINILTSTDVNSNYVWDKIQPQLLAHNGPYVQLISSSSVSGSVAADTTRNAFLAVVAASLFILLYIWFSFRKVSKPWRYGTCAIVALLHDALVVLGIFSILGALFNIQIDALFITALLTVIGFSVHDTIVVFDRIRENMHRRSTETFEEVVNASLVQTMTRSLNTSLTVLLTLLTLTLFGIGTSIFTFTLALLIGIISGTYSSIFNASMLLVMWEKGETVFGLFNREPERVPVRRSREARELARTR
jgi:preprotein translocase subunit SecF